MSNTNNTNNAKKAPTTSAKYWYDQFDKATCPARRMYCLGQIIVFVAKHPDSPDAANNACAALEHMLPVIPKAVEAIEANPTVLASIREGKNDAILREKDATIAALNARIAALEAGKATPAPKAKGRTVK